MYTINPSHDLTASIYTYLLWVATSDNLHACKKQSAGEIFSEKAYPFPHTDALYKKSRHIRPAYFSSNQTDKRRNTSVAFFNNPNITNMEQGAKKTLGGFRAFILRGNVVDLAVGIMIGAAFTAVVSALVTDIITPVIPVAGNSLANLHSTSPTTGKPIMYGAFIQAVISFLILAFVIYFFIVVPVNAMVARYKPKENEVAPTTRDCPYCFSSVNIMATRCAYCTSPLPPLQPAQPAPPPQRS
jgi:large conductance mechanosensitive channel